MAQLFIPQSPANPLSVLQRGVLLASLSSLAYFIQHPNARIHERAVTLRLNRVDQGLFIRTAIKLNQILGSFLCLFSANIPQFATSSRLIHGREIQLHRRSQHVRCTDIERTLRESERRKRGYQFEHRVGRSAPTTGTPKAQLGPKDTFQ